MLCPNCGRDNRSNAEFCDGCGTRVTSPNLETAPAPSQSDPTPSGSPHSNGRYVGRQKELGQLQTTLDDALSGRGQLVMLLGEPGIGKTRTAQELAGYAESKGVQVLWGWCYEEEGALPYWPWIQPIRAYIRQQTPEKLRDQMGVGAADIAEIVAALKTKLPDLKPPPASPPEQARFRLFDSIVTFLKNVCQAQPLMLVLDDLHWADKPSLLLLQFLARQLAESRLLVVGCYRDMGLSRHHPLSESLAQLTREPTFQRYLLCGLDADSAGRFIETTSGTSPSQSLVDTIYAHTEGNPFFIAEVVRLLTEQGKLSAPEGPAPVGFHIPQSVREVIGQRLNRLSKECNQILGTASIVGREFDFRLLRELDSGVTEDRLIEVLEEGQAARVIEERSDTLGCYYFTHALIQATLTAELSLIRRARLHAHIAGALEKLYGASADDQASELAYHFSRAESLPGLEKLVHYSLLAGQQALAAYAHEEALEHFQRGLAAKKGQPADAQTAALLFGLGRAQMAILQRRDLREAVATLNLALDSYVEIGDLDGAVLAAELRDLGGIGSTNLGLAELVSRGLSLVPSDSHQAGRLLSQLGLLLFHEKGDYEGSQEALSQALAIARREKDLVLEMCTLVAAGHVQAYALRFPESLELGLRAIELAHSVDEPIEETHARLEVASVLHRLGDLEGARRQTKATLEVAERLRNRARLSHALLLNMIISMLEGDWPAARDFNDRGLAIAPRQPNLLGYRAIMEYTLGDTEGGETYLERLLEVMRTTPPGGTNEYVVSAMVIPVVAKIAGRHADLQVARQISQDLLASAWVFPVHVATVQTGMSIQAWMDGDVATARKLYSALAGRTGTMLGGVFESVIAADRLLGLLATTLGETDPAATHFEKALVFCRQAGYRPELAWTCYDYADALLRHSASGDRSKVQSLLEESRYIATQLGMGPLVDKVVALEAQARPGPAQPPTYPAGLTEREMEVLNLIAQGATNSEISGNLVLSQRTVQRHISNIYTKIKARNRAEATTFFLTHVGQFS